jgi:hypothetical protein
MAPFALPFAAATYAMLQEQCNLPHELLALIDNRTLSGHSSLFTSVDGATGVANFESVQTFP